MLRRRAGSMLCALVVLAALAIAPAASAFEQAPCELGDKPISELTPYGAQFVTICLLNQERVAMGLSELTPNKKLFLAGYAHSTDMEQNDYFSHFAPNGFNVVDRVQAQGYAGSDESWQVGEILAWASADLSTPRAVVKAWMASPAHRAVISEPAYREVGVGIRQGAPVAGELVGESATYTAVFGVREPLPKEDGEPAPEPAPAKSTPSCRRSRAATRAAKSLRKTASSRSTRCRRAKRR